MVGRTPSMSIHSNHSVLGHAIKSLHDCQCCSVGAHHAVSCSLLVSFTPTRYGPTPPGAASPSGASNTALDFASGAVPGLSSARSSSNALTAAIRTYGYTSCTCIAWLPDACIAFDQTCVTCSTRRLHLTSYGVTKMYSCPPLSIC